ncbi:hypothetical protein KVL30_02150 [Helicobacter pylori]|nr:hypothetical protein KVL30_02150 [Helicobacter pylori]
MLDFLHVEIRISPIAINKHNKLPMGDLFSYAKTYKTKSNNTALSLASDLVL